MSKFETITFAKQTKNYQYKFSCNSEEFGKEFSKMLRKFFEEHEGKISIKEA